MPPTPAEEDYSGVQLRLVRLSCLALHSSSEQSILNSGQTVNPYVLRIIPHASYKITCLLQQRKRVFVFPSRQYHLAPRAEGMHST